MAAQFSYFTTSDDLREIVTKSMNTVRSEILPLVSFERSIRSFVVME